ncbi:site-specific integrase [Thermoactinomyces sp. DSM 45892]|uniref:site-specific integrase n=1 Tax=Thermoactinomyces sp. DSM 45892 TaxID=1882753 RepID=UPI00089BCFA2|nr:site-specific integrase [Thermoactinomyces sp. DSM 45892]SDY34816.1 Site-specific recombinase XerD [Thermoactinomyces sp. DSM 45892]
MRGHVRRRGYKYCFVIDIGRDPQTGKRKQMWSKGFDEEGDAEKAMIKAIYEMNQGIFVESNKITFGEFLCRWLEDYAQINCAPKTFEFYELVIQKHIIPSMGKLLLTQLKPMHIQNYYSKKLTNGRLDGKGGLSARSVHHHHRLLHEVLEHAVKWQLIFNNPVKATIPPKPKKKRVNALTKEQVLTVLQLAGKLWCYPIIFFALNTGMRRGEILGLRWKDVDLEKRTISISYSLQRVKKKGLQLRPATKTEGSRRSLAISNSVVDMLKKVQTHQASNKLQVGEFYQDNGFVFSMSCGKPIDPHRVSKEFRHLVKKSDGIPYMSFHDLRHCHATLLLQQGEHPKVVSERLGHSTITLTMDTYSHVLPNMQKEAADKLDKFLFED